MVMANILGKIFSVGAEKLVSSIGDAFAKNFTSKEEKLEAERKIQELVTNHVREMEKLSNEQFKAEVEDRASARNRESEFVKATGHVDWFQYFIGTVAVLSTVGIIIFILNQEIPTKNEHIAMLIIGEILGITTSIYSFHYGSSQGSRLKDLKK